MNVINKNKVTTEADLIKAYSLALVLGILTGFNIIPSVVVGAAYVFVALACIISAVNNNLQKVLSLLPYIIYNEIYARKMLHFIPYLFAQYILILTFLIFLVKQRKTVGIHTLIFVLLICYFIIEFLGSARTQDITYARMLMTNTLCLTLIVTWGSMNFLPAKKINSFLNNVKIAGIYLVGYILVAHIKGDITYGSISNSSAGNGLAPVQLSGYLSFVCILFFWEIMNNSIGLKLYLNIALLSITAILMVLTFSRGGLYIFGITIMLYIFFNRTQLRSYYLMLLLIPIAIFGFLYVTNVTGGKIEERYSEEGSSGRDRLIQSGLTLFLSHPVVGVGTANFNTAIIENDLYDVQSGAHNEFVRAAAEHGMLGIFTFVMFFGLLFVQILQRRGIQREYAFYFFVIFCLITIHNGLKISLQPLILMLAVATPSLVTVKKKLHVQVA